jgi:hypothetical protein
MEENYNSKEKEFNFLSRKRKNSEGSNNDLSSMNYGVFKHESHIKIIDFSPITVYENSTSKILIVIESYLNFQNLKMLENQIRIKFDQILMPCTIVSSNLISSFIPYGTAKEILIQIILGNECISDCNSELKFKYIKQNNNCNTNLNNFGKKCCSIASLSIKDKKDALIFYLSENELKKRILNLLVLFSKNFTYLKSIKKESICEEFFLDFINNHFIFEERVFYKHDYYGYNIIHYISSLG